MFGKKARKGIIFKILKSLYGCIESALMWYILYKDTLKEEGFELNPYDKCTANKIINDKHCTIQWYVDDNKVTYFSEDMITGVVNFTKKSFGELVVSCGKKLLILLNLSSVNFALIVDWSCQSWRAWFAAVRLWAYLRSGLLMLMPGIIVRSIVALTRLVRGHRL